MIVCNFIAGIIIDRTKRASDGRANATLALIVAANLSVLALWKYAGFATRELDGLTQRWGWHVPLVNLALPLGISFFTFHCISYVVDVHRGVRQPLYNPVDFTAYIAQFPQLVAGPIIRYHEIADQLSETGRDRLGDFAAGFPRFALGLSKKVVIADSVAVIADASFSLPSSQLGWSLSWLGALAYTVQIYFDFSGYSDMAIGLGRMFGFTFPENFNRPYSAVSVTDFWRRWHMSLSNWFREYLYIPLGGNRSGTTKTYRNLIIVFFLTGLWHGANWTFIAWGLYHGALLIFERASGLDRVKRSGLLPIRRLLTLVSVMVGWVLFRSPDIAHALQYLRAMFVPHFKPLPIAIEAALNHGRVLWLVVGALSTLLPASFVLGRVVEMSRGRGPMLARIAIVAVIAPYAAALVASGTFSPFLYFQF